VVYAKYKRSQHYIVISRVMSVSVVPDYRISVKFVSYIINKKDCIRVKYSHALLICRILMIFFFLILKENVFMSDQSSNIFHFTYYNFILKFRYSLNGKPGYVSGGSTMNSTRSMSTNSDHYAIMHRDQGVGIRAPPNTSHITWEDPRLTLDHITLENSLHF